MQASHGYSLDQDVPTFSLSPIPSSNTTKLNTINPTDERLRNTTQQFRNRVPTSDAVFANLRHRPRYPRIQCRWTYPPFGKGVETCRYGKQCQYGHEGDEYYEQIGLRYHWVDGARFVEKYAGAESTTSDQAFWAAGKEKHWREGEQGIWGFDLMKMYDQDDGAVMVFGKPSLSEGYSSSEESVESSGREKKRRMTNGSNHSNGGGMGNKMWTR